MAKFSRICRPTRDDCSTIALESGAARKPGPQPCHPQHPSLPLLRLCGLEPLPLQSPQLAIPRSTRTFAAGTEQSIFGIMCQYCVATSCLGSAELGRLGPAVGAPWSTSFDVGPSMGSFNSTGCLSRGRGERPHSNYMSVETGPTIIDFHRSRPIFRQDHIPNLAMLVPKADIGQHSADSAHIWSQAAQVG